MEVLTYTLTMFASFLGLIIGVIISNMAIEEIEHVSKYLRYVNILFVPTIILIATYNINKIYSIIFAGIALIAIGLLIDKYNDAWIYSCMGALFYVSTLSDEALNVAILIFVYGICIATVNTSLHFKKRTTEQIKFSKNIPLIKNILKKYSYYLFIGIVFYATFSLIL
jgi:hypothetical protein